MDFICDYDKCTGCGACKNICPKNAITIDSYKESGHLAYKIDQNICIDCGMCKSVCPANNIQTFYKPIKTYAAWTENSELKQKSSSGGIAAQLYLNAIAQGFFVTGTLLENDFSAKMKLTNEVEDICKFQSSKYMQADTGMVYKNSLKKLKDGNKIMFVGMPCQCAAMRSIANNQAEETLTVELICHGTPSYEIFKEYLNLIEQKTHKKIDQVQFRSPKGVKLTCESDGAVIWSKTTMEDDYLYAFQNGLLANDACYTCQYAKNERASDITIGDFWGIGENQPFNYPKNKVSLVLINTENGLKFWNSCQGIFQVERLFSEACVKNPQLSHPIEKHVKREQFINSYKAKGLKKAFREIVPTTVKLKRLDRELRGIIKTILRLKKS